jgi:hypothetical protein
MRLARSIAMVVAVAGALCLSGPVEAQSWPQRAITLVVAFPPATTVDVAARAIAQDLTKTLGQPVVVENRPGGGGVIGTVSVVKAAPDGYTLLMAGIGPAVVHPLVDHNLAYDPVADLTPVILVGDAVNVLAASPQRGWASVADVVAYAKQRGLTIGHSGPGTINHLLALLFSTEAGIGSTLISYQGSAPIVSDLAGGQIDTGFIALWRREPRGKDSRRCDRRARRFPGRRSDAQGSRLSQRGGLDLERDLRPGGPPGADRRQAQCGHRRISRQGRDAQAFRRGRLSHPGRIARAPARADDRRPSEMVESRRNRAHQREPVADRRPPIHRAEPHAAPVRRLARAPATRRRTP